MCVCVKCNEKWGKTWEFFSSSERSCTIDSLKVSSSKEVPPIDVSELHRLQFNIFRRHSDVFWSYPLAGKTSGGWIQFKLYLHDEAAAPDGCLWELGCYVFRRSCSHAGDIGPMDRLPVKQNCRVPCSSKNNLSHSHLNVKGQGVRKGLEPSISLSCSLQPYNEPSGQSNTSS